MLEKITVAWFVLAVAVIVGLILTGRLLYVLGNYFYRLGVYANAEADRLRQTKSKKSDRGLDEHEDINRPG